MSALREASSVILLRRAKPVGFEVFMLRRQKKASFMASAFVFPGGGAESDEDARTAAVRELFEEAGVLLAGTEEATLGDISAPDWEADRVAVANRELTMTEVLDRRGLRLRDDLLLPWSRWITPEFEPKRFDTWFFIALLPEAQTARDVSGEADRTAWISPQAANGLAMLPPTRSTLDDLSAYRDVVEVVAAATKRDAAAPVMPRVELTGDGGAVLRVPKPQPKR